MMRTILIASHNRGWIDRCAEALLEEGHLVRIAFNARMASDALDRVPTDLIVVDDTILRAGFADLVRALSSRLQPIPIVVAAREPAFSVVPGAVFVGSDQIEAVVKTLSRDLRGAVDTPRPVRPPAACVIQIALTESAGSAAAV